MLKFTKIEYADIFTRDFSPFVNNNIICFPSNSEEIAVIYGPNGTGKTSLIKVLSNSKGTKVEFEYEDTLHTLGQGVFHIINDQNNRNIIAGETKDFFMGDNIRHEFELQNFIISEREKIIAAFITMLKNTHGISAANSPLIEFLGESEVANFIKDIANNRSKGKNYTNENIAAVFTAIEAISLPEYNEKKLQFLKGDLSNSNSIIKQIEKIANKTLSPNSHVHEIEENTEAINVLSRFPKSQCIVCDTDGIDWESLLAKKTANRTSVYDAMDNDVKALVEKIIEFVPTNDPFEIKTLLLEAIDKGDKANINILVAEFDAYKKLFTQLVLNDLIEIFSQSELPKKLADYQTLVDLKPEITEEDMLYIQEIISSSMSKPLMLERDEKKNLKIKLQGKNF